MDRHPTKQRLNQRPRRKPDARNELPRAVLRGGDPLRGGEPGAVGHAGRNVLTRLGTTRRQLRSNLHATRAYQHAKALSAIVLLALAQLLMPYACVSTAAIAASGFDPRTVTLSQPDRHQIDGHEAYCANVNLNPPPVGSPVSFWESGSALLDYTLYHSDGGPDPQFSWEPTRYVVWTIMHDDTRFLETYVSGEQMPADFSEQVKALYYAAVDWVDKGAIGPERGCSRIYAATSDLYQPLAMCVPTRGDIALEKTSGLASISSEGPGYSLAGAHYAVYADEGCTSQVATLVTDDQGKAQAYALEQGTYFVREIAAPSGFALDNNTYSVTVTPQQVSLVSGGPVQDLPLYAPVGILLRKGDSQLVAQGSVSQAQGDATLAGARFVLSRFANTNGDTSGSADRSWTIQTDEKGIATLDEEHLVSGDEPYRAGDGSIVLPLGTYVIEEEGAPEGYALGSQRCCFLVEQQGSQAVIRTIDDPTPSGSEPGEARFLVTDEVIRGGVRLGKVDLQRGDHVAQGAAKLDGAQLAIELTSDQPVMVNGSSYTKGSVVTTLSLGPDGTAETAADALPYGSYLAYEVKAPEGYLLTPRDAWSISFQVREPGVIVDLSDSANSVADLVKRGDLSFVKVDGQTMGRLANVPFSIESLTTGERHVLVTDDNGQCSTQASFNPHSSDTNANDLLLEENTSHEPNPSAGIWFSGGSDREVSVDDSLGALPYDTYRISELPCEANKDYELVTFEIRVSRDQFVVDGGTVDDHALPSLQTRLGCASTSEGSNLWELVDTVYFNNLAADGTEYEVRGTLHLVNEDGSDGGVLTDADGNEITAASTFTPAAPSGQVEVPFSLDAGALRGATVVAFEQLWLDGACIASHEDVSDVDQSLTIPQIHTQLSGREGEKEVFSSGPVTLVDTVHYEGLTPGSNYQLRGTLMDKESGEPLTSPEGTPLTAEQSFIADASTGSIEVPFSFDGTIITGRRVVAFESLVQDGIELAIHADLEDEDQTISSPSIHTVASDAEDGDHFLPISSQAQLVDTVSYQGLIAGESYVLEGSLVQRLTGEPLQSNGEPFRAELSFTPESSDGEVALPFSLDTQTLVGQELTVFEHLTREGQLVASHDDLSSDAQSLSIPVIGTIAQSADGGKYVKPEKDQVLVDTVHFDGLIAGESYRIEGELHLRDEKGEDQGPLTDQDGEPVAASAELTPDSSTGEIELSFSFDASQLAGKDVVAFERLLSADGTVVIASHQDIGDGGQSLHVNTVPEEQKTTPVVPKHTTPAQAARGSLPKTGDLVAPFGAFFLASLFALSLGFVLRKHNPDDRGEARRHKTP